MRGKIAGDRNEDAPGLVCVAPYCDLPGSRLEHLLGVEARMTCSRPRSVGLSLDGYPQRPNPPPPAPMPPEGICGPELLSG